MRFVVISKKDEVLRASHAVMSELFHRRLVLPQYARKRIRWCEVVVSVREGRAVAVQRFLAIFTAVKEQLGLRLEPAKISVDSIVIDSAQKPSSN